MNFLYQLGVLVFRFFSPILPIFGENLNEFPLSAGSFGFSILSPILPILEEEFFLVCKITKNMPKSLHLFYGKNNHYGLILNQQAMTVMGLLTKQLMTVMTDTVMTVSLRNKEKG